MGVEHNDDPLMYETCNAYVPKIGITTASTVLDAVRSPDIPRTYSFGM